MAKKKGNTKGIIIALAVAGAAYFLLSSRKSSATVPQNYPPAPPRNNTQAWATWASQILSLYGQTSALFQPGGPFYNVKPSEVNDAINTYNPSNPYDMGGGGGQWV